MRKVAIVHFNPIELYPPAMNWINFLSDREESIEVKVFTMKVAGMAKSFQSKKPFIEIIRPGSQKKAAAATTRFWNYLLFYARTTLKLLWWRPDTLMYYETYSSLPAVFYKKICGRSSRLFIHYHEYTSVEEYARQGRLIRWLHRLEKKIYPSCAGLSHTNAERMQFFLKDNQGIVIPFTYILPNYPPGSWKPKNPHRKHTPPLKIIYIGAVSLETMYTKEFIEWVLEQKGDVIFDIYSSNCTDDAKIYLQSIGNTLINYYPAVEYYALPGVLAPYDVGVILYKGHIPNYIYNAPNKLFEYLACGLDVWLPGILRSSQNYVTANTYPQVISINFSELDKFAWRKAIDRGDLAYKPSVFYCEGVFNSLWGKISPLPL